MIKNKGGSMVDTHCHISVNYYENISDLIEKIRKYTPSHIQIISQGEYVAASLDDYLMRHPEINDRCSKNGQCRFLTTESESKFQESASIFLQEENIQVESISLG